MFNPLSGISYRLIAEHGGMEDTIAPHDESHVSPRERPHKRVRIATTTTRDQSPSDSPARARTSSETGPRTRGPTACEKCRSRKTRCDNRRPCGYCAKHQLACVYDDDTPRAPTVTSEHILDAIHNLSEFVQYQSHRHDQCCQRAGQDDRVYQIPDGLLNGSDHRSSGTRDQNTSYESGAIIAKPSRRASMVHSSLQSQGMESILAWEPLAPFRSSVSYVDVQDPQMPSSQVPNIDIRELSRLEDKYIDGVHVKNPFLDLADLHHKILQVSENGLDWSTQTCLVTLVCAIGAITQRYQDPANISTTTPSPGVMRSSIGYESETELSKQFWGIAARRLGFAVNQNDVEAVQCLCLAGIYHMHRLDALSAWKYFNLAGAAWHAVNMTDSSTHGWLHHESESSFTVMQSLYFTVWKSDCELKLEMDVPGPILDNVEFPHAFPLAPNLGDQPSSPAYSQTERTWYYYLAEIAARHMLNRILRSQDFSCEVHSERQIRRMIAQADEFEEQLHQWYLSLPSMFYFEIPTGYSLAPHPDELVFILRHRYLACRELIGRPFLKLCVERPLQIDPELRLQMASLGSQSLQYSLLRISKATPQLHQGTWFVLRNLASTTLLVGASSIAKRYPELLAARDLVIPIIWKDLILRTMEMIDPYWEMNKGGISETKTLIHAVLNECFEEAHSA